MSQQRGTIKLHLDRETKGTYMFACDPGVQDSAGITNLYIRKKVFNAKPPPKSIDITYEWDDTNTH